MSYLLILGIKKEQLAYNNVFLWTTEMTSLKVISLSEATREWPAH